MAAAGSDVFESLFESESLSPDFRPVVLQFAQAGNQYFRQSAKRVADVLRNVVRELVITPPMVGGLSVHSEPIQSSASNVAEQAITTAILKTIISESSAKNLRL